MTITKGDADLDNSTETIWIPMPDGTHLAARLWQPQTTKPVPTILEYIPYRRRDRTRLRDDTMHPRFAEAGYAAIRVDMRGSGDSEGLMHDEYLEQEIQDGCDVIAWIAAQEWSDGQVGMFGKSWGAYTSYQIAARRPPALRAIAPVMGTDDRWADCIHFSGGCLQNDNFWWGAIMQLFNIQPPDPAIVGEDRWLPMWKERLESMTLWTATWLEHQTRDAYWRHGSICEGYGDIEVPVYAFGGWADAYRDPLFRLAENLSVPYKVMIGPWAHLYPQEGAPGPQIDFPGELIRWWDHWMKGVDTGLMDEPPMRLYLQEAVRPATHHDHRDGHWVEEPSWPSPNITAQQFWLNSDGLGAAADPSGDVLSVCTPTEYGKAAGDACSFAIPGDLPLDARLDGDGALVFRGAVATETQDILGNPHMHLTIAADQPQAMVAALLLDEAPDGTQTMISRGYRNLMHVNGPEVVTPLVPGQLIEIDLSLHATSYRLPVGHRLMLKLSSGYWPILWPSPTPVTISVAPGTCSIDVPTRQTTPDAPAPRVLAAPPATDPPAVTQIREGTLERGWQHDVLTEALSNRVAIDGGVFGPVGRIRLDDTGTEVGDTSERIYAIGPDPLSAQAVMFQSGGFTRESTGWHTEYETQTEMTATATHFYLRASVRCVSGDEEVHYVEWDHEIARNGM